MNRVMTWCRAAWRLVQAGISPVWLFRSCARMQATYERSTPITIVQEAGDCRVTIGQDRFLWPNQGHLEELVQIAAEQSVGNHPHRYCWGPTPICRGDVVVDVGACEGAFTRLAARLGGGVYAIEPSRDMACRLRELVGEEHLESVKVVEAMVGTEQRTVWFRDDAGRPGMSHPVSGDLEGAYRVDVKSLDQLVDEWKCARVDFIKCDAEGADLDVLKSAGKTLRLYAPKIAVCTYHVASHFDEIRSYLQPFGYRIRGKGLINTGSGIRVVMLHACRA